MPYSEFEKRKDSAIYYINGTESFGYSILEKEKQFCLKETNRKEILNRRIKQLPTFVLKKSEKLYLAEIADDFPRLSVNANAKKHLCYECTHCRATLKQLGGCSKARDCSIITYLNCGNVFKDAVILSKRIEKYPFIKYGYETFGIYHYDEVLCVEECDNFKSFMDAKQTSKYSVEEILLLLNKMKDAL